jgi:hypothetical protein
VLPINFAFSSGHAMLMLTKLQMWWCGRFCRWLLLSRAARRVVGAAVDQSEAHRQVGRLLLACSHLLWQLALPPPALNACTLMHCACHCSPLSRHEQALKQAEAALADEWLSCGSRLAMQRRVLSLGVPAEEYKPACLLCL